MVIDSYGAVRIHLEGGPTSWASSFAKGRFLLLLEGVEHTKDIYKTPFEALPLQLVEKLHGKEQPIAVQYLQNATIEAKEGRGWSNEGQVRLGVKVVQVFEPSQSWLVTGGCSLYDMDCLLVRNTQ